MIHAGQETIYDAANSFVLLHIVLILILTGTHGIAYWLGGNHEYRRIYIALARAGVPIPPNARPATSRRVRKMLNERKRRPGNRNVKPGRDEDPIVVNNEIPTREIQVPQQIDNRRNVRAY